MTTVVEDAKLVSSHAKKKVIDIEDVKLAVQIYNEQNFTAPPAREVLLDVARTKNSSSLPIPKPTSGLRLPPDRFCLTACNFRLKAMSSSKKHQSNRGSVPYSLQARQGSFMNQTRPNINQVSRIQIQPSNNTGSPQTSFTMTVNPP